MTKTLEKIYQDWFCRPAVRLIFLLTTLFLLCLATLTQAIEISERPMSTLVNSAPTNIMFILDNSGSMDWETMTEDGVFGGDTEYIFDDPGDNNYSTSSDNGTILSGAHRLEWKSQWAGHNKIYYNPFVEYKPWPRMTHADTSTPRSNPNHASPTFDLRQEYYQIGTAAEIVVDNGDVEYSENGSGWTNSNSPNRYGGTARYNMSSGRSATWTPSLANAGSYEVYAWWNCYNQRDTNAKYTIAYDGGSDTVYKNQRSGGGNTCGAWVLLGTYNFSAGSSGSVTVERHAGSTGDSTLADAVKFVYASSGSVSIKRAHYYTWDDSDADGNLDSGESVYLVNFVDSNNDNSLDSREYYLVTESNGDVTALTLVNNPPSSIKPKIFNEDGSVIREKTAPEDLQNFADWYSFYRRRELTAKAAVAHSIYNLKRVKIGYYTINSGVRVEVQPVGLDGAATVIVDNNDAGYSESGSGWKDSGSPSPYAGSARYNSNSGRSATWTPSLPAADTYDVYAWWNCYVNRDTNAEYTIVHSSGTATVNKSQTSSGGNACGEWVQLGTWDFAAGNAGSVTVTRHSGSSGSSTLADAVKFESTSAYVSLDETDYLLDQLYSISSSGGTPLREALDNVGKYFDATDTSTGGLGASPYMPEADGGACQKSYSILMTDGYWNGDPPSGVNNADGTAGAPYADSYSTTLADVAMKYYLKDLSSLPDLVPPNSCDKNPVDETLPLEQHMVTYTLSFGLSGTIDPADIDNDGVQDNPGYQVPDDPSYVQDSCFDEAATPRPSWPDPTAGDSEKIDDLWHAAVNGHGLFFSAENPEGLTQAISSIVGDMLGTSSGASAAINGGEAGTATALYQARYESGKWFGDVVAYPVNSAGEVMDADTDILWQAGDELEKMLKGTGWNTKRKVITYNGTTAGSPFRYANLTAAQKVALDNDSTTASNIVDYLRGRTDNLDTTGFRRREKLLGDIVHSSPVLYGDTLYVGSNDGMLHAFDTETGEERFAYVPNLVFDNLKDLKNPKYTHKFFVDMAPFARKISPTETLLVGGLGKGGKGYYALNIAGVDTLGSSTNESTLAGNLVMWEYPKSNTPDNDMGYSFSKPVIVRTHVPVSPATTPATYRSMVIFGNGYSSSNGHAVLYVLNTDGTLARKIDTGVGGDNGLSTPSVVDDDGDMKADYAYAGDLKGNMWKFDLRDPDPANWDVAFYAGTTPKPLFQAIGQPITSKPDVMGHRLAHGNMVIFGTGKFLGESDRSNTDLQSMYGIWDYGDDDDDSEYLGTLNHSTGALSYPAGTALQEQTIIDSRFINDSLYRTFTQYLPDWTTVADGTDADGNSSNNTNTLDRNGDQSVTVADQLPNPTEKVGWFIDFPTTDTNIRADGSPIGERIFKNVTISEGRAILISFIPNIDPCSSGGDSFLYIVDGMTGGRLTKPEFDLGTPTNLINIGTSSDPVWAAPTGKMFGAMLNEPTGVVTKDGRTEILYLTDSDGELIRETIRAEKRGKLHWREY